MRLNLVGKVSISLALLHDVHHPTRNSIIACISDVHHPMRHISSITFLSDCPAITKQHNTCLLQVQLTTIARIHVVVVSVQELSTILKYKTSVYVHSGLRWNTTTAQINSRRTSKSLSLYPKVLVLWCYFGLLHPTFRCKNQFHFLTKKNCKEPCEIPPRDSQSNIICKRKYFSGKVNRSFVIGLIN